jgi:hypothetical protein
MLSWKYLLLLAGGTLALAAWAGYRAECHVMDSAGNKPLSFQSVVRRVTAPKERTERIDKLNDLRHRAGRSELSPEETAAAWEIIRALGVEDLKACLEEIPVEPSRMANDALMGMLFSRWGQLDPEAAAQAATQDPYKDKYMLTLAVAGAWADRDPEGLLRWSAQSAPERSKRLMGNVAGKLLVRQNPAGALDRALAELPSAVDGVVAALATQPGDAEESRRAVLLRLAALPDSRTLQTYVNRLARHVAGNPEVASRIAGEFEQVGLTDQQIQDIKAIFTASLERYKPPHEAELALQVDTKLSAAQQQLNFERWSWREPEKAVAWAEQNARKDLLEANVKAQAMSLLRSNWQPGVRDERGSPYVKGVVQQYESWRKLDATAAESWLKTMPADIRKHLSSTDAPR